MTKPRAIFSVARVKRLVDRYYARPGNGAGGSLHVVLDDNNLETSTVLWCAEYATERGDWSGARLARIIALLSMTQRRLL